MGACGADTICTVSPHRAWTVGKLEFKYTETWKNMDSPTSTDSLFPNVPPFVLCASKGGPTACGGCVNNAHPMPPLPKNSPTTGKPLSIVVFQYMTHTLLSPDQLSATRPLTNPHFTWCAPLRRGSSWIVRRRQEKSVYVVPCQ